MGVQVSATSRERCYWCDEVLAYDSRIDFWFSAVLALDALLVFNRPYSERGRWDHGMAGAGVSGVGITARTYVTSMLCNMTGFARILDGSAVLGYPSLPKAEERGPRRWRLAPTGPWVLRTYDTDIQVSLQTSTASMASQGGRILLARCRHRDAGELQSSHRIALVYEGSGHARYKCPSRVPGLLVSMDGCCAILRRKCPWQNRYMSSAKQGASAVRPQYAHWPSLPVSTKALCGFPRPTDIRFASCVQSRATLRRRHPT
ncbi:hypothetical protein HDV57DRAFT_443985 [Trichoderma longibrachiatum]